MKQIILKEELEKLKKITGKVRGIVIETYGKFILREEGEEGLRKLEQEMSKLDYPIKYRKIKVTSFYPMVLQAVSLTVIKRLFNYDEKMFQKMGRFESKADTVVIRFFMKYFISLKRLMKAVPKMWKTYFTVGDIKAVEFDEEKRYIILRLENFNSTPILCENLKGYFEGIFEMVVKKKANCEQTKCSYWGDEYHEFLLKW
jgi:predicted hydrocarbon binding protein